MTRKLAQAKFFAWFTPLIYLNQNTGEFANHAILPKYSRVFDDSPAYKGANKSDKTDQSFDPKPLPAL
jgi:hypothetical protein